MTNEMKDEKLVLPLLNPDGMSPYDLARRGLVVSDEVIKEADTLRKKISEISDESEMPPEGTRNPSAPPKKDSFI